MLDWVKRVIFSQKLTRIRPKIDPGGSKIDPGDSKIDPGGSKINPGGSKIDPGGPGGSQGGQFSEKWCQKGLKMGVFFTKKWYKMLNFEQILRFMIF